MGGMGSGGWNHSGRATTDALRRLDIAILRRSGVLSNGWRGSSQWRRDGERTGSIGIIGGRDQIVLVYRIARDADAQDVRQTVRIIWSPCRFGGEQPHFLCPECGHSRRHLYGAWPHFICRACAQLTYASRRERALERTHRRVARLRHRVGADPQINAPLSRPKHMHHTTYDRIAEAIMDAEAEADDWFLAGVTRLLRRGRQSEFWR